MEHSADTICGMFEEATGGWEAWCDKLVEIHLVVLEAKDEWVETRARSIMARLRNSG